jgi:hypothetical protein
MVAKRIFLRVAKLARARRNGGLSFVLVAGVTLGVLFVGLASDASAAPEAPAAPPTNTIVSKNWAGYAGAGHDPYHKVSASWNVPLVSCSDADILNPSQSVTWVGLGGSGASAAGLEQIGTRSWCQLGRPSYNSWLQVFPGPHEVISEDTKPGDQMRATAEYLGRGDFRLTLSNYGYYGSGLKWTEEFIRHQERMDGAVAIAECIVEAPATLELGNIQPLSNFDYVGWQYCRAHSSYAPPGEVGIGEGPKTFRIHMSDYREVSDPKKAYTSKIFNRDKGSFRVDWKNRFSTGLGGEGEKAAG